MITTIQQEALKKPCAHCETGKLHEVEGETETFLWCDNCDLSMDSDGGFTV